MEYQAVGVGNMLANTWVETCCFHDDIVRTAVFHRFATCDDVGRNVFRKGSTCLDHGEVAHTSLGILHHRSAVDDTIANDAVTGNLRTIAEYTAITHYSIVGDMCTFHQEVLIAQYGFASCVCATVDDNILADGIVVANFHKALSTFEIEILR